MRRPGNGRHATRGRDGAAPAATAPTDAAPAAGLSEAEARRRLAERGKRRPAQTSRSYASIVRANTLTIFNAILVVFGILTLTFGDWRDALFLGTLVANTTIGIGQEVRAKRALDRLAALVAPTATVVRDGQPRQVAVAELVTGDLVRVKTGDQIVADGTLVDTHDLSVDVSILTGESDPLPVDAGDDVRSGSFAAEGAGAYTVESVGADSYAERLASEARAFRRRRSPLERAVNRLLLALVGLMLLPGRHPRIRPLSPRAHRQRGGLHRDGRRAQHSARGTGPASRPHLRGGGAADGSAGYSGPAAQCDRVARVGRRHLHRQDRYPDRTSPPHRGAPPRAWRRPRSVRESAGPTRGERAGTQQHPGCHRRRAAG